MTSLLHALTDAEVRAPANADRLASAAPPAASEEAIRLALQLRDTHASSGGRLLMFVPASRSVDASLAVADALCGLLELHEGPVLVMDLRSTEEGAGAPAWLRGLSDDDEQAGAPWGAATSNSALIARPFANRRETVPYAASPEFAGRLAEARSRYAYVLCIGGEVSASVETLMMAPLVDGVVLTVAPSRMTRPQMHRLTDQLRRAHANLIGFVVDARSPQKGAGR